MTYHNPASITFAGRTPQVPVDRWCETWKLFAPTGEFLPHDQCPMAAALTERRAIRGLTAVAERPDGTCVAFMPYPTPILRDVDILDRHHRCRTRPDVWRQAGKGRRLARSVLDCATVETLERLADEYEAKANLLAGPRAADDGLYWVSISQ